MSKSKVNLSPDAISDKWKRRITGAVQDIVTGIDSVTDNPMEAAAGKKDKMLANITRSIQDGSWEKGLKNVSLSDWKSKTKAKVSQRLAGGVEESMGKRRNFDTWMVNRLNGVLPRIKEMPDLTIEDSINRVRAFMEHMSKEKYKAQG